MQTSNITLPKFKLDEQYWMQKLTEKLTGRIPYDFRCGDESFIHAKHSFSFDEDLSRRIVKVCQGSDLHMLMVMITGSLVLLKKYSSGDEVAINTAAFKGTLNRYRRDQVVVTWRGSNTGRGKIGIYRSMLQTQTGFTCPFIKL